MFLFFFPKISQGATYYVSKEGLDANPGTESQPFLTIQKAAGIVQAGDTIYVKPGIYEEHVKTKGGGTGEDKRITFKAVGIVTMQGFDIDHPYITIDGFDITGYTNTYRVHISISSNGNYCEIKNNTIRDGASGVYGISFYGEGSKNCIIKKNNIKNLNYFFYQLSAVIIFLRTMYLNN